MRADEEARVRATIQVGEKLYSLEFDVANRVAQAAGPGRYLMLSVGDGTDPYLPRPYWVRRTPEGRLRLLVEVVGPGSSWLSARRPGDTVRYYGPLGKDLELPTRTARLLLSGPAGGLNCLLALADAALDRGVEVALAFDPPDTELAGLLPPAVELLAIVDADSLAWADAYYCVGEATLVQAARETLRASGSRLPAYGVPHVPLACGVGACYGCVVATRRGQRLSCVDGPAFALRELV